MSVLTSTTEQIVTIRGELLRLSFEPDAIRKHFERCGKAGKRLAALPDGKLAEIGLAAMESIKLETAVIEALRDACEEMEGFDPDGDPDVDFRS